jgi:ABC-type transport system substrate-binding protein
MADYWSKVLNRRLSRRRAIAVTGSSAAAAAFLAACGGGDDDGGGGGGTGSQASGLVTEAKDTSSSAKTGGTMITTNPADPPHFDPHLLTLPAAMAVSLIFNKLLTVKPGINQITDGSIEADMAESWEFSPDKLTLTMKIRKDVGTPPNQAPLNGRKLDASDVVYSWDRWAATGSSRQDLVNSVNPAAPVMSLTATDASTVQVKLKEPISSILSGFAQQAQGQYFIMPKESDSFDVRKSPIGAGAYYLSEYIPSSKLTYLRNPNSYDKKSYPDKIETPIITENSQVIAQLVSGGIYAHYTPVPPDSVVQIKKDQPKIALYKRDIGNVGVSVFFGFKAGDKAPFKDERLRQAFSMAMDRDLYLDTWANVSKFKEDGLEVETKWNTAARPSDYKGWYLDPQSKDFGENAKYFEHNIAEAKKLMAAAGFPNGVSMDSHEAAGTNYGLTYAPQIEVVNGMAAEAGFKFTRQQYQAPAPWNADYRDSRGFFDGIAYRLTPVPPEPGEGLFALYNKDGSLNYGFDAEGKGLASKDGPFIGDPTCDDLTKKMRTEFDNSKRVQYAHDLQKYLGRKQYFFHSLGSATGFNVAWPAVQNFAVFNGLTWGYLLKRYWLDTTKAPFA